MDILIATLGVFFGELYGNFVGGGSLLTQFVLQNILHMPLKEAMALDNTAVIGSNLGLISVLIFKYKLERKLIAFFLFALIGAFCGAKLLIFIDENILKIIFVVSIILLVFKNLLWDNFVSGKSKNKEKLTSLENLSIWILAPAAFVAGFYNSAFVIGDWVFSLLLLTQLLRLSYSYSVFVLVSALFFAQPVSSFIYFKNGLIDLSFVAPMLLATFLGGVISAKLMSKIKEEHMLAFLKFMSIVFAAFLIYELL